MFILDIQTLKIMTPLEKRPRESFINYFNDLHGFYNHHLNIETFYEGSQFSFPELGEILLDQCNQKGWLKKIDILLPVFWAFEFDSNHAHCGSYFQNRYPLNCESFDVCEQGTIASFTGLHLLKRYFNNPNYNRAIMVALEQTTIPRDLNSHAIIPTNTGGCALLLQNTADNTNTNRKLRVMDSIILDTSELHLSQQTSLDMVLTIIYQHFVANKHIYMVSKKNSNLWKQLRSNFSAYALFKHEHLSSAASLLTVLYYLETILNNDRYPRHSYFAIIDEDVESLNLGILLLELL